MRNITNVVIGKNGTGTAESVYQYSYGITLRINNVQLPNAVEVQFSLHDTRGESITRIGLTHDGVTDVIIPDSMLENGDVAEDYNIFAWVYVRGEKTGTTEYKIVIPVLARAKPAPHDTPAEAELFQKAIDAVNESANRAEAAGIEARSWAIGETGSRDGEDTDNARYYAQSAAESAEIASEKEQAVSSAEVAIGKLHEEVVNLSYVTSKNAENAAQSATAAGNSAAAASASEQAAIDAAGRAEHSEAAAAESEKTATAAATAAEKSASAASSAQQRSEAAQAAAAKSAEAAATSEQNASSSETASAQSAQAAAESEKDAGASAAAASTSEKAATAAAQQTAADRKATETASEAAKQAATAAVEAQQSIQASADQIETNKTGIESLKEDIENVTNNIYDVIRQTNLFDKNSPGVTSGYYLSPSEIANQSYSISDYIPVKNNKTYSWYSDANALLCLYDSSKKYLGYIRGTALTAPEIVRGTINNTDAVYCRFSYKNATKNKIMFVESETYPSVYIEYITSDIYKIKPYISQNPLYGKKVGVVGDSIMYGEGFKGGPISIIADRNNMSLCNKAISGSKITISGSKETIYNQLSKLDSDCDYILFDGGVNDMLLNNLGTITNGFDSSYDESTFCGSFEKTIHDLITMYPTKKIGYISVHRLKQWSDDIYSPYENTGYYRKTIEILEKWGIPICNLTKNCISLYENSKLKEIYTKNGDGWHPDELGYRIYYVDKIESWMKTL